MDKYPESEKALSDAGHEVMNHTNTHPHMSQLSREEILADVTACSDKIEAVTGVRPTLFRPPYGEYDDKVITAVRSLDVEPIQWDVDGSKTASSIAQRIYMGVLPGIRTETGEPLFCTKREHFCVVDVPVPTALRAAHGVQNTPPVGVEPIFQELSERIKIRTKRSFLKQNIGWRQEKMFEKFRTSFENQTLGFFKHF